MGFFHPLPRALEEVQSVNPSSCFLSTLSCKLANLQLSPYQWDSPTLKQLRHLVVIRVVVSRTGICGQHVQGSQGQTEFSLSCRQAARSKRKTI